MSHIVEYQYKPDSVPFSQMPHCIWLKLTGDDWWHDVNLDLLPRAELWARHEFGEQTFYASMRAGSIFFAFTEKEHAMRFKLVWS